MTQKQIKIVKYVCSALTALAAAIAAVFGLSSCGITRATISRPAEGTTTTVTITTNNPVTTSVDPNVTYEPK